MVLCGVFMSDIETKSKEVIKILKGMTFREVKLVCQEVLKLAEDNSKL